MTNKGALCSTDINLMYKGKVVSNENDLAEHFNEYYIL